MHKSDYDPKFLKKYVDIFLCSIDQTIRMCELLNSRISLFKEYPSFLNIFSSKQIIAINTAQRQIPEIIEILQELKKRVESENYEPVANGKVWESLKEIQLMVDDICLVADLVRSEIPEAKLDSHTLLVAPHLAIIYYISEIIRKVKIRRLKKKKERLRKKKEILKKVKDIILKK